MQAAISSAIQAAIVVHTMLTRPEDAEAAKAFYRDARKDAVERLRAAAARHYAAMLGTTPTSFWRQRAATSPISMRAASLPPPPDFVGRACLSREARIEDVPVIERDHITWRKGCIIPRSGAHSLISTASRSRHCWNAS